MKVIKKYWWVVLLLIVAYLFLNKKLLIKMGLKISYKSDADKIRYSIKKVGNTINVYLKNTMVGQVVKDNGEIYYLVAGDKTQITNAKDLKFFSSLLN